MYGLATYERQQAKFDALRERFERHDEFKFESWQHNDACLELNGDCIPWSATLGGDGEISNIQVFDIEDAARQAEIAEHIKQLCENDPAYKKLIADYLEFELEQYLEREC